MSSKTSVDRRRYGRAVRLCGHSWTSRFWVTTTLLQGALGHRHNNKRKSCTQRKAPEREERRDNSVDRRRDRGAVSESGESGGA